MNIGILTIHGFAFHPNGRLKRAAQKAGHRIQLINPYRVICSLEKQHPGMGGLFADTGVPDALPDVVLPRQGSPMGEYGFVLLRQLHAMGIPLVNGLEGVTIARHQYITLQTLAAAGIRIPDSCFITRPGGFFAAVDQLGGYPVIAKQPFGMGGEGVAKIDDTAGANACVENMLDPVKGLVVQQFFPPEGRVDTRILVIGGRVAGAMKLTPSHDNFRSNIHQNGRARAFDPPAEWANMAVSATRACSLDIAGIDMMHEKNGLPHVVEVNYSPGFRGLEAATGKNIAKKIIDHVEHKLGLKTKSRKTNGGQI